jgi:hypothetical protein
MYPFYFIAFLSSVLSIIGNFPWREYKPDFWQKKIPPQKKVENKNNCLVNGIIYNNQKDRS